MENLDIQLYLPQKKIFSFEKMDFSAGGHKKIEYGNWYFIIELKNIYINF